MKFIVRGFTGVEKSAEGFIVYAGDDGTAADEALMREENGVVRKDIIKYPVAWKTRVFEGQVGVEMPEGKSEILLKVRIADLPEAMGLLKHLAESLEEANKRLVEAGKEPVLVIVTEEIDDLDEEELKALDAFKALEDATRTLGTKEEDNRKLLEQLKEKDEQVLMLANAASADGQTLEALRKELDALKASGTTEGTENTEGAGDGAASTADVVGAGPETLSLEEAPKPKGRGK